MSQAIHFSVNGQAVDAPADMGQVALLGFLREALGLRRTRFGCGSGSCGACTVIVNGQAQAACDLKLDALNGCQVETAETLGTPDQPHPVMSALLDHQAAQCAYCVSGIAMRVKALLASQPQASDEQILQALDHHLCRCGAQTRMLRAIRQLFATGGMTA